LVIGAGSLILSCVYLSVCQDDLFSGRQDILEKSNKQHLAAESKKKHELRIQLKVN
jgi:hypothetical protein